METNQSPVTATVAPAVNASPPTRQARAALFAKAAKAIVPENAKSAADPLQPWRQEILKSYKHGYSVRQIAEILATPEINVKVSQRAIRRLVSAKPHA